jgi:hypothetical protein
MAKGCGCKLECSSYFDAEHYQATRDDCREMKKEELDLVVLGQIMAFIHTSGTVGTQSRHTPSPRQRSRVEFAHNGRTICKVTFLMLHGIVNTTF